MPVLVREAVDGMTMFPPLSMVVVAVPPKYAVPKFEKRVELIALGKMTRFGSDRTGVLPPDEVISFVVPDTDVTADVRNVEVQPPSVPTAESVVGAWFAEQGSAEPPYAPVMPVEPFKSNEDWIFEIVRFDVLAVPA
jgi:hypothetical protein